MDKALDAIVGGRDPLTVRCIGLRFGSRNHSKFDKRIAQVCGLEDFTNLISLDLAGNMINDIEEIKPVPALEELDLSKNRIRKIDGIGRLRSLRILNISSNMVDHLPKQIGLLSELRWLDVSCNKLSSLTELSHLSDLAYLSRLNIRKNPICDAQNLFETVLKYCRHLVTLDGIDVRVKESTGVQVNRVLEDSKISLRTNSDEVKHSVKQFEDLLNKEKENTRFLTEENQQLRSELEATSQLLARKTSEWAVAEELASRLQQELAFLKIDSGGSPTQVQTDPEVIPVDALEEEKHQRAPTEVSSRESLDGLGMLLSDSPMKFFVQSGGKHSHRAVVAPLDALKEIEKEIEMNAMRTAKKLKSLNADYVQAKRTIDTLQSQLDIAISSYNRTKQEHTAAEDANHLRPIPDERHKSFPEKARKELSSLCNILSKLRALRMVLKPQMEATQDLLVVQTEKLVMEDDSPASSSKDMEKLDLLETNYERACVEVSTAMSNFELSVSNEARNLLPDISILCYPSCSFGGDEEDDRKKNESGTLSNGYTTFDPVITKLSEQVNRTKEQESLAKECIDLCLNRISHIEATLDALVKSPGGITSPTSENSEVNFREHVLRASVEKEAEMIAQLHEQLKSDHVRLREIHVAMLRLKCDSWKTESTLRSQQCSVMFRVVEQKNSTIDACNRTISRLQENERRSPDIRSESQGGAPSAPLRVSQLKESPVKTVEESNMRQARSCMKKLFSEFIVAEAKLVENLETLLNVYLIPFRRRALLVPRDLHVVNNNFDQLLRIQRDLLENIQGVSDNPAQIVNIYNKHMQALDAYTSYSLNFHESLAMINTRRHTVSAVSRFMETCEGKDSELPNIQSLMLSPLRRFLEYEHFFNRILALNKSEPSGVCNTKLLAITNTIQDIKRQMQCNESELLQQAKTMALFHRILPPHSRLSERQAVWLSQACFSRTDRKVLECIETVETLIMEPSRKAVSFHQCYCVVFSDFVVLAAHPLKWRATFPQERPKLRACLVLSGNVSCSDPFCSDDENGQRTYCARIVCRDVQCQEHEALVQFSSPDDAERIQNAVNSLEKITIGTVNRSHESRDTSIESRSRSPSPPPPPAPEEDISKLPGTNMTRRREVAKKLKEARGAWKRAEEEHANAALALERIRKRDCLYDDPSALGTEPTTVNRPGFTTPIKTTSTRATRRTAKPESLGFGSSVRLGRCKPDNARTSKPQQRSQKSPRRGRPQTERRSQDHSYLYFEDEEERAPDMSIFKSTPVRSLGDDAESAYRTRRLIGLEWKSSEYVKASVRMEQKYL